MKLFKGMACCSIKKFSKCMAQKVPGSLYWIVFSCLETPNKTSNNTSPRFSRVMDRFQSKSVFRTLKNLQIREMPWNAWNSLKYVKCLETFGQSNEKANAWIDWISDRMRVLFETISNYRNSMQDARITLSGKLYLSNKVLSDYERKFALKNDWSNQYLNLKGVCLKMSQYLDVVVGCEVEKIGK